MVGEDDPKWFSIPEIILRIKNPLPGRRVQDDLRLIIGHYESLSLSDLCDMIGVEPSWVAHKFNWHKKLDKNILKFGYDGKLTTPKLWSMARLTVEEQQQFLDQGLNMSAIDFFKLIDKYISSKRKKSKGLEIN